MSKLIVIGIVVATVGTAHADGDDRSEHLATGLATAGWVTGPVLIGAALYVSQRNEALADGLGLSGAAVTVFAPSAGNWYAGKVWSGGLIARLVGAAAVVGGFELTDPLGHHAQDKVGRTLALTGAFTVLVGGFADVLDASATVRSRRTAILPTGHGLAVVGQF